MFKKTNSNSKKGFTLIEIMIVIAIIGILVGIAIAAGSSAKKGARDNQRKTDVSLLQVKLESYREQYGKYPALLTDLSNTILPKDPTNNGGGYQYIPLKFTTGGDCSTGGVSYYLYATLENKNSDTATHLDFSTSPPAISGLSPCSGSIPSFSANIYDVTSPR